MEDFWFFVKALAVFAVFGCVCFLAWIGVRAWQYSNREPAPQYSYSAPPRPEQITHTVSFLPGQYANIPNKRFRKVEIRSQFPIRVLVGPCHENYTVEFFCNSDPSDIFITDMRRTPIFSSPQANEITITVTEY